MLKHIIGQSIYQFIVMMVLVFLGEQFIPEYADSFDTGIFASNPEYKWHNGVIGGTVRSGRFYNIYGDIDYFIFNAFVMMQVFNFLNARKLHEEVLLPLFSLTSSRTSLAIPSSS